MALVCGRGLAEGSTLTGKLVVDLAVGAHLSGSTTAVIVRWVRGQLGDPGVADLLGAAGERRSAEQLEQLDRWSSYKEATALLEAAVTVTGRTDAARRIGEEMLAQHRETSVLGLLRSLGSPEALLASIAQSGAKFSTVFTLSPGQVEAGYAEVIGSTPPGIPRHRLLCDFTQGILSIIPTVFDLPAAIVTQSQCQARGGSQCEYTLTWETEALHGGDPAERRVVALEKHLERVQLQLLSLHATATEMLEAVDTWSALELVTKRAGEAVKGTGYLLAVHLTASQTAQVHCHGMSAEEAASLAPKLLRQGSNDSTLVAHVVSAARRYGVLAAVLPDGARFFPQEQELLEAYAGYAASLLDTAWALTEAHQQNDTARALLELSRALADLTGPGEVAQRLATAVPKVVDCDQATVLLWDTELQRLRLRGSYQLPEQVAQALMSEGIGLPDTPVLSAILAHPEPLFIDADETDPFLCQLLHRADSTAAAVVPILWDGHFLGIIAAAVADDASRLRRSPHLLERLQGLAHQAATALTNARLVSELQSQARRDHLTGIANRAGLMERLDHAIAGSDRDEDGFALLFLDLDGFKQINDRLGHLAGDGLLVEVAARLQGAVRPSDLVARLGGDEFAVLLHAHDPGAIALKTASRILRAISRPYALGSSTDPLLRIGVSVGISVPTTGVLTSTQVLREADDAMYAAKAAGGGRWHRATR